MRNIGFDLRVLDKIKTGVGRYAYDLFSEIIQLQNENYMFIGETLDKKFDKINRIPLDLSMNDYKLGNKMIALLGYTSNLDLLHSPFFPLPERRTFKTVLTIHDLIALKYPQWSSSQSFTEFYDADLRKCAQHSDHIIAVSEATKKDVVDLYNIEPEKITVVYEGVDDCFFTEVTDYEKEQCMLDKYHINGEYILSVCTIEPRKNMSRTIQAYETLRKNYKQTIKLVLVGRLGWQYEQVLEEIKQSSFADDIILTGYVVDEDLPVLYRNAEVFVYASLYEGFGLPVLEAMASGTPVITSNISSLPEVGGDAVLYCNPYDIASIAEVLQNTIAMNVLKEELRLKGRERAKLFSWRQSAIQTHKVYNLCLG